MLVQRSLKCAQGIHCEYVTPSHSVIQCPCSVSTWAQSRKLSAQVHSSEYYLGWVWQSWLIHKQGVILTAEVVYWESIPTPFTTVMKDCKKCLHESLRCFQFLQEGCGSLKLTLCLPSDYLVISNMPCIVSVSTTCVHRNFALFILGKQWRITLILWSSVKVGGYEILVSPWHLIVLAGVSISGKIQEEM